MKITARLRQGPTENKRLSSDRRGSLQPCGSDGWLAWVTVGNCGYTYMRQNLAKNSQKIFTELIPGRSERLRASWWLPLVRSRAAAKHRSSDVTGGADDTSKC
jgi:hypothetical protein